MFASFLNRFSGPTWQWLFRSIFPPVFLLVTLANALVKGMAWFGSGAESRLGAFWQSSLFVFPLSIAIGAHALGHYLVARRHGINAYPPYFIPQSGLVGVNGAYTKLTWPIESRKALVHIFAAGPIAGCTVSAIFFTVGLTLSMVTPHLPSGGLELGQSLLTMGIQHIVFPGMVPDDDITLHPIAFAGWIGFYFNLWQLFPAGRLDGGRLVYALWGYRRTVIISWVTIAGLLALGFAWKGWVYFAIFAVLTMIRLKNQYPIERHEEALDLSTECLIWATLVIFTLIFTHAPVRLAS